MDQFEAFFKRADLDGDGRISGAEAVAFFRGSGLSQQVLAKIWMYADQSHSGFLGRQEFYNALKLVTVAQSKRELTPDLVKAAVYGPAAAKIPPPQINTVAPTNQPNMTASVSTPQGSVAPPTSQNLGIRATGALNPSMNQHYFSSQPSINPQGSVRPLPATSVSVTRPPMTTSAPEYRGGSVLGQNQPIPANVATGPPQAGPVTTAIPGSSIPSITVYANSNPTASKPSIHSGNGNASESGFGGDMFSAYSTSSTPASAVTAPVSSGVQSQAIPSTLGSSAAFSMQSPGSQHQQNRSPLSSAPQVSAQSSTSASPAPSGLPVGVGNSVSGGNQPQWPKMKPADVQKYTKVFMEVDTDKDGKISGEQARNLFLSWRLPREVLKQVWDLSDQDNDSMLSLREFCFALYLMERYREGRPLPGVLPNNLMYDETLLSMTGQPNVNYRNAAWGPSSGFLQQQGMGARPVGPVNGFRPPTPGATFFDDGGITQRQRPQLQGSDDPFANQLNKGEQNLANSTTQERLSSGEKVAVTQNKILDSKEKMELYRSKMQDIVLFKSRCENRLNEITERASANKREAEILGKKYEEKHKQVTEIASKLTIEDARFREVQQRKIELQQAIVNMEQGGSTDGILQVRVDRIQSDLEELMKALTERSRKQGFDVKSIALIELPTGWQPGIQEGAALWDEDWDKFEDEGFGNELAFDAKNVPDSSKQNGTLNGSITSDLLSDENETPGPFSSTGEQHHDSEYTYEEDDSVRSPVSSPAARTTAESLSSEYSDIHHGKNDEGDRDTHGSFDDSNWGAFDTNDDVDSIWGVNTRETKDTESERHNDFYGSNDFGVTPTDSQTESVFQNKSTFAFDDSVPSTPMSKFGYSPPRFSETSSNFDSFSRFDSFSNFDSGFTTQPDRLTRFDTMDSSRDLGGDKFSRFDSMNSSKDFSGDKFSRFDSMSSSKDFTAGEKFTRFDSINSTLDVGGNHGYSFDDADPFGSTGPFKVSSDNRSPKKSSDNWNF